MNKKFLTISLVIMILVSGFVYANDQNFDAREMGKQIKKSFMKESQNKEDILCYANDIKISEKKFNTFKETSLSYNKDIDEETLLENYIKFVLLVDEAEKEGFTVSKQENEIYTNELFKALESDTENMQILKDYTDGMGITMSEYKDIVKEYNYKLILTMKLQDKLELEFLKKNKKTMDNNEDIHIELYNYLENYKEEIYNNAKIIKTSK